MTPIRMALTFLVLCAGALVMGAAALGTAFRPRRFHSEVIGRAIGSAVLRLWGIRFDVHYLASIPPGQKVFISNHSSTLDVFILVAMALPRTRFFLSRVVRRIVPLAIIGGLLRVFWTVPQQFPAERRRIFARAAGILRETGESVYLSPEGMRVATGEIGAFNKGSFHLATDLRVPIVPLYIAIPPDVDPGRGYVAGAGDIDVYVLPAIDTSDWTVEDVAVNRDRVHTLYQRVHAHVRRTGALPSSLTLDVPEPQLQGVSA